MTFPECYISADNNAIEAIDFQKAVNIFRDKVSDSELFNSCARKLLSTCEANGTFQAIYKARELAVQMLLETIRGEKHHKDVKSRTSSQVNKSKEIEALECLLPQNACRESDRKELLSVYYEFVHSDPAVIFNYSKNMIFFFKDVLKSNIPPRLQSFVTQYEGIDLKKLTMLGEKLKWDDHDLICNAILHPQVGTFRHMLVQFRDDILDKTAEHCWPQIDSLSQLAPILSFLGEVCPTRDSLERKLKNLRVMIIANRNLARPVALLDSLSHTVYEMCNASQPDAALAAVCKILKSQILINVAEANLSMNQLVQLFQLVDSPDLIARKNFRILRQSKFVIDMERLASFASEPFDEGQAGLVVSLETGDSDSKFRLLGGRVWTRIVGQDMFALFTEVIVQINSEKELNPSVEDPELDKMIVSIEEMQARAHEVLKLANVFLEYFKLGWSYKSSGKIDFNCVQPEQYRLGALKIMREKRPEDEISSKNFISSESRNLRDIYLRARDRFPWTSFCFRRDVMTMKDTPWVKLVNGIASTYPDESCDAPPAPTQLEGELFHWLTSKSKASLGSVESKAKFEGFPLDAIRSGSRIWLATSVNDDMMTVTLSMLQLLAVNYPLETSLLPCDCSVTHESFQGLIWRIEAASELVDRDAEYFEVARVLLCQGGVVIHRPETLKHTIQDLLVSALLRYMTCCSRSSRVYPVIALILPEGSSRFQTILRSMVEVRMVNTSELIAMQEESMVTCTNVKSVVVMPTVNSALGRRPDDHLVPSDTFRVQLSHEMTIQDLVRVIKQRSDDDKPISLDFGSSFASFANGSLSGVIISYFLWGVVGQLHLQPIVLRHATSLYAEIVCDDSSSLKRRFPILKLVPPQRISVISPFVINLDDSVSNLSPSFHQLVQSCTHRPVYDRDVMRAMQALFEVNSDAGSPNKQPLPFVYTPLALTIISKIALQVKQAFQAEATGTFPVLLSGDTGTGKTYLLYKFLELLMGSGVLENLSDTVSIYTLSARFKTREIEELGLEIKKEAFNKSAGKSKRREVPMVILDEVTSSPAQEAIKRLMANREIKNGVSNLTRIKHNDLILLGTCNPDPVRDDVFSLSQEMETVKIDVQNLDAGVRRKFIEERLQDREYGLKLPNAETFRKAVVLIETSFMADEQNASFIGCVSLRDAVRCISLAKKALYHWPDSCGKSIFEMLSLSDLTVDDELRALGLSCYICFGIRTIPRAAFFERVEAKTGIELEHIICTFQDSILNELAIPSNVVKTQALKENLTVSVICLALRHPLLLLGCDGTSKTLSLNMAISQMQGKFSKSTFLQGISRMQSFNIQLSEATSASHIAKIKSTVLDWEKKSKLSVPCIFMEELSMAKMGSSGPLRALHDVLDAHQDTAGAQARHEIGSGSNPFAFVATSNYKPGTNQIPIGRALANRMIVLAHPDPSLEDLKSLAVRVGMNESSSSSSSSSSSGDLNSNDDERVKEIIENAIDRLSVLVPHSVSVRSLLSFARCLGMQLSRGNDELESCLLAATCHLQKINPEETSKVLRAVMGNERYELPSLASVLESLAGLNGTKRPIMFLYQSVGDIYTIIRHVRQAIQKQMKRSQEDRTQKVVGICPCSSNKSTEGMPSSEKDSLLPERLYALLNLKSSVEAGGTTFLLNPEPMLQGMHALLNDFEQSHSTLQINECNENVSINPTSHIILLVHWESSLSFHSALLSRTAIVNLEMFGRSGRRVWDSPYSRILDLYAKQRGLMDAGQMDKEIELLEELETPLDSFIRSIVTGEGQYYQQTRAKLTFIFVDNILPCFVCRNSNILAVDGARHDTQSSLLEAIQNGVKSLANDLTEHVCLMIDLSSSDSKNAIEVLALLGFSGFTFRVSAKPSLSQQFMKLSAKESKRVVVILNSCLARSFSCGRCSAWKEPNAPMLEHIMKHYFIRNISIPYPDWPSISDIAKDPSTLFLKFVATVHDRITETHAMPKTPNKAELLLELCKTLATSLVGEDDLKNLLFCPYQDLVNLTELRPLQEIQESRLQTFSKVVQEVRRTRSALSLRSSLVERCLQLSEVVAAKIVSKVSKACLFPDKQRLSYIRAVLSSQVFPWQRDLIRASMGGRAMLSVASPFLVPTSPSVQFLPFVADMLEVVLRGEVGYMEGHLDVETIRGRIQLSFPSLLGLELGEIFPDFIREVILYVARKHNLGSKGWRDSLSCQWLEAASQGDLARAMWVLINFESWIAAGTLFCCPPDPHSNSGRRQEDGKEDRYLLVESLVRKIVEMMRQSNQQRDGNMIRFHAILPRLIKFAIENLLSSSRKCHSDANLSSLYQVTLLWQLKQMSDGSTVKAAFHQSCEVIFDKKLDNYLNGFETNTLQLLSSVFLRCHEIKDLPDKSIARVVNKLGVEHGGPSFLASCARIKNSDIQVFLSYLDLSFQRSKVHQVHEVARREETRVVARGLRYFFQATGWSVDALVYFIIENRHAAASPWAAMYLALSSILIPSLVQDESFLSQIKGEQATAAVQWKQLFAPSYSLPVKNFLIRCLVSRFDERGMYRLKDLPSAVGEWARPYVKKFLSESFQELSVLPDFMEHLEHAETDSPWLYALTRSCCSLRRTPAESLTGEQTSMLDAMRSSLEADMDFCSAAAALWCAILVIVHDGTVLTSASFTQEQNLSSLCLPAAPDGNLETIQKYKEMIGVTSINRCPCGYVYGIGNCGRPDHQGRCPECGQALGGNNHQWANNVSHTLTGIADDTVRGVETSWCFAGPSYTERGLHPMEYRLLSVLLLIPLAVWSPRRGERREQLAKHWAELRAACGLSSDTETQLFVIGVMKRATMMNRSDFAFTGRSFHDKNDRQAHEKAFSETFQRVMGGETCQVVIAEASRLIQSKVEEQSPFIELRDSRILAMDQEQASRCFAPQVLQVVTTRWEEEGDERLMSIRLAVTREPDSFPVLARCLFDRNSSDVSEEHAQRLDLDLNRKLSCFPSLAKGLWRVGAAAAGMQDPPLAKNALEFIESWIGDADELQQFKLSWEVCRFGHRIGCQIVSDVGDLSALQVRDLLWVADSPAEVGLSRTELLLQTLTDAHNQQVELLSRGDSSEPGEGRGFDVSLSTWETVERLPTFLIPWDEARSVIEKFCRECPNAHVDASSLESIAHQWISQRVSFLRLLLNGWPRLQVLDESSGQVAGWMKEYGLRRDVVVASVRLLDRMAQLFGSSSVSGEAPLVRDSLKSMKLESDVPALLGSILEAGAGLKLKFKHLKALQECLLDQLDYRQEEALAGEYRHKYEGEELREVVKGLEADVIKYAFDKSVALCEMVSRNLYSHTDPIQLYLPYAQLPYEEDDSVELETGFSFIFSQPVQLRHLYGLTCALREAYNELR
ncbi:hypothetical protein GUITHDRAFT_113541 [Guillardia theta CCMP2712]|uniref:RZ-type domain-containing protein n=3 Tax=Guillardia theta TaxID=55529 RepID=L1IVM9_GUITC|nr:hypothetical protein GUITHDRAFT_113541 [Guillardia theta CCMP2712]EKX40298.1 hypothetical protein GUITHDRAFT_113541 [Guillardia theta CCMP2712]|eukprot:XP_005827278.1 hypothetical protein GUITHDRAFT_113541 [Guillardia theta CCMP2712]